MANSKIYTNLFLTLTVSIVLSCVPNNRSNGSDLENSKNSESSCSNEPFRFLDLPEICQLEIVKKLTPEEIVRFAKGLSTQTEKVGYTALLNRAMFAVPQGLQSEIEKYVKKINRCLFYSQDSQNLSIKNNPVFVEKLLTFYLNYLAIPYQLSKNYLDTLFMRTEIRSDVDPIIVGDDHVVFIEKIKSISYLKVIDVATLRVRAQIEIPGNPHLRGSSLVAVGPRSFLLRGEDGKSTLWKFTGDALKKLDVTIPTGRTIGHKNLDVFFILTNGKLIRHFLNDQGLQTNDFGAFPPVGSLDLSPSSEIFGITQDKIITLENTDAPEGKRVHLKTWQLSSKSGTTTQSFRLVNTLKFEGEMKPGVVQKNNILSFTLLKDSQVSFILFDTKQNQQVVKIDESKPYDEKRHFLTVYGDDSFLLSKPLDDNKDSHDLYSRSASNHLDVVAHIEARRGKKVAVFSEKYVIIHDGHEGFEYGSLIKSIHKQNETPNAVIPKISGFFRYPGISMPDLPVLDGGFLVVKRAVGFSIFSPWAKILERYGNLRI